MTNVLASPDAGVVWPAFGILILLLWVVINLIERWVKRIRRPRADQRRGFEVKTAAGDEQRKTED
jgi:hypothetical protein